MKQITWLSGWGVEPESLRSLAAKFLPQAEHHFLPALAKDFSHSQNSDVTIGWSLGAWRLLQEGSTGRLFPNRVVLLAPFLAFCAEQQLGGRCAEAQVRWLKRWIQRDPVSALQDFHKRAEIHNMEPARIDPTLEDGLDALLQEANPGLLRFAKALPDEWLSAIGEKDELLNPQEICTNVR